MRLPWQTVRFQLHRLFFGAPYQPADHAALVPRGGSRGIRAVLLVVGVVWLGPVIFDNLARLGQRQPKSWRFFQGPRELNAAPNEPRQLDLERMDGDMTHDVGSHEVARPYRAAEDTMRVYLETDAQGFRTVRSRPPFTAVLCGDSFSDNNSFADSLARATGLAVGNQAIKGRGTLAMARFLEDWPPTYRHTRLVIWECAQRDVVADYTTLATRRRLLRQTAPNHWLWRESLLWPGNLDLYLNGSSLVKTLLAEAKTEGKWAILKKRGEYIITGRRDLPQGVAPMLYLSTDEGIRPKPSRRTSIDSIADCIAAVNRDLQNRGQQLIFTIAPEKSIIYPERLPVGLVTRTNYVPELNQALRQRGVYVVNIAPALRQAALAAPRKLYYYTTDTHWTPRGMAVAAQAIADSLVQWRFISSRQKVNHPTPRPLAEPLAGPLQPFAPSRL